ncbi:Hypothetical protein FKW44_024312 [Caligus rogercresseyi]|uniref:Uncharacterized protein n=1 Tax=Caligus rogercresseyi TaxID=217165 RepID=A0A7T8GLF3_CALRO|nr:Hypothetical protein FKW44_024687 [Caligus rogercresseyi]QQP33072.1 Hypothetical protein FKW44_024312 [Caligus rogercresseyi]
MSLCCEIGVAGSVFLSEFRRGEPSPVPLTAAPVMKNPPRRLIRTRTAEVCTL